MCGHQICIGGCIDQFARANTHRCIQIRTCADHFPVAGVIENGFYNKVEIPNSNEKLYAIEFVYYVRGEECNWGGYSIQMDSQSWSLNLYKMQLLIPDEKHSILDTFTVNNELVSSPVVIMQGYQIGSSEAIENLYAEYILQPK